MIGFDAIADGALGAESTNSDGTSGGGLHSAQGGRKQHSYFSLGRIFPRGRIREAFVKIRKRFLTALYPAGAAPFTGAAALTTQPATLAATATFAAGTKTAIAALTTKPATLTATATFAAGTKTATAALAAQPATLTATATFSAGTKTATAALTTHAATLSAAATFAAGTKTATAALTTQPATLSATATFAAGTKTATATLTTQPATLAAAATFAAGTRTATAALTTQPATLTAAATFVLAGPFTGTAALTTQAATLSATASFAAGTHTATAALTTHSATLTATATYSAGTETATATLTTQAATLSATASFSPPVRTATAALTTQPATLSASAIFSAAVYVGTANLVTQPATLAAVATYFAGLRTAVGTLTTSSATLSATASFSPGVHVAGGALTTSPATLVASATFTPEFVVLKLPGITEQYKRALEAVLCDFFDGGIHTVNCQDYTFPAVEVVFDIRRLQVPRTRTVIVFTGFTDRDENLLKSCYRDPQCAGPFQPTYEIRIDSSVLVYVAAATEMEDVTKSKREVDRIYDLLSLLFRTEAIDFASRGIFNAALGLLATEQADTEYAIVTGRLTAQLRATYTNDGTFTPTQAVTLPGVTESYKRCLYDLLSFYFDGTTHTLNCQEHFFPDLEIVFDTRRTAFPTLATVIQFTKFRQHNERRDKLCLTKPGCPDRPVYGLSLESDCHVCVFVPLEMEDVLKSKRQVDRIYDLLNIVLRAETAALAEMNILRTRMTNLALEQPDLEYAIVGGTISSQLFVDYAVSPAM